MGLGNQAARDRRAQDAANDAAGMKAFVAYFKTVWPGNPREAYHILAMPGDTMATKAALTAEVFGGNANEFSRAVQTAALQGGYSGFDDANYSASKIKERVLATTGKTWRALDEAADREQRFRARFN